jgi:hypothetical protein
LAPWRLPLDFPARLAPPFFNHFGAELLERGVVNGRVDILPESEQYDVGEPAVSPRVPLLEGPQLLKDLSERTAGQTGLPSLVAHQKIATTNKYTEKAM